MFSGWRYRSRVLWLLALDVVAIVVCINIGSLIRYGAKRPALSAFETPIYYTGATTALVVVAILSLYVAELYRADMRFTVMKLAERVIIAFLGMSVVVTAIFYFAPQRYTLGRVHLALTVLPLPIIVFALRWGYIRFLARWLPSQRTAILGMNSHGDRLVRLLVDFRNHPYDFVGYIYLPHEARDGIVEKEDLTVLGGSEVLEDTVRRNRIDTVIVAVDRSLDNSLLESLVRMKFSGVTIEDMGDVYRAVSGRVPVRYFDERYFLYSDGFAASQNQFSRMTQRIFDIVVGLPLAVLLSPVALLIAAAVKLESRGPIFFVQERVGLREKPFRMLKFRTMTEDAPTGGQWMNETQRAHQTRLGSLLRRTRLNEIPQLINILRGDMSLIGPRPETPDYVRSLVQQIPFYHLRHFVKPGLSGWAAVNTGYASTVEETETVVEYDLYYIENMSILLNLVIILKTLSTVLFRPGE